MRPASGGKRKLLDESGFPRGFYLPQELEEPPRLARRLQRKFWCDLCGCNHSLTFHFRIVVRDVLSLMSKAGWKRFICLVPMKFSYK
jgi:hypothetical protein